MPRLDILKQPHQSKLSRPVLLTSLILQTVSSYFLHIVFPKIIITTTSTIIIPNAIYAKNAGRIFSSNPIINIRSVMTDIPIPTVLHSFFSLYFSFSSFEAVLYPEINQLPCPESKTMESTANIIKTNHTIQSEPVDISASFIYMAPPKPAICRFDYIILVTGIKKTFSYIYSVYKSLTDPIIDFLMVFNGAVISCLSRTVPERAERSFGRRQRIYL